MNMPTMQTPPDDTDAAKSHRRKACDLCFTKKIKCDMLKPVCSNCKLYSADCKTSIVRRKANPPKPKPAPAPPASNDSQSREGLLESRLASIESQLQQVLQAARDAHMPPSGDTSLSSYNNSHDGGGEAAENPASASALLDGVSDDVSRGEFWKFNPVQPHVYEGEPDGLSIPPLDEVIPAIDHYFSLYNAVIPLFHQPTFMKMLHTWYTDKSQRDRGTWAAINIVLALSHRTPRLTAPDSAIVQIEKADQCLKNAQSVISELVTRESDLIGLQILLGIVMLFQNSRDPKPASVIIGTAMRLTHRLQLHAKSSAQFFAPDEAEQRSRVFWIAYTLDKDISLRAQTPSTQLDDDIDVPLPALAPPDSSGLIWTQNGQVYFNYHRRRVELAHIQGKVYDLLYSNRATKVSVNERKQRVQRLQTMLDQWYERIPTVFHIDQVAANVGPSQLIQLTKMHHAFLLAEIMTHGVYSHSAEWIKRISSFSRAAIENMARKGPGEGRSNCHITEMAPLPEGWSKCVEISRGCMKLFQGATPTECIIWQCSCAHFSSLIIILANMSLNPAHAYIAQDQHLVMKSMNLFDQLLEIVDDEGFQTLRAVASELSHKATAAIAKHRAENPQLSSGVFESLGEDADHGYAPAEPEFLPREPDLVEDAGPFAEFEMPNEFDHQSVLFDPLGTDFQAITEISDLGAFLSQ